MKKFTKITESVGDKYKLGLDFHGVIDAMPDFFSFLTKSFIKNGGEVHILTGGHWDDNFENKLREFNISWTHKFSIYDHLIEIGSNVIGHVKFPDGTIQKKFEDGAWDKIKGEYCKKHNITLHIDDTLIYNDHFSTPFARLWSHNMKPKATHKDIRHLD